MLPVLPLLRQSGRADPLLQRLLQLSCPSLQTLCRSLLSRRPAVLRTGLSLSTLVGKAQCTQPQCRSPDPAAAVVLNTSQKSHKTQVLRPVSKRILSPVPPRQPSWSWQTR